MLINKKYTTLSLCLLITLSSCAIRSSQSIARTNAEASIQIREYKYQSQKDDLSKVIENKSIRQKDEFLVPVSDKSVHMWINYFSKRDKARFERFLTNGAKYKTLIQNIFTSYDLPKDLYYVGLIESGYYLGAKSRASAVGPWQFIRATGKRYDLAINSKVDERRSIIKATHAAARYFQDLYNIFGSWELALAGYNAGEYGVIRRIRGANTRDFYKLCSMKKLPRETRNYVPKVLAAMEVAKNNKKYSVRKPSSNNSMFTNLKKVTLKGHYSLNNISVKTNVTVATIKKINSDIRRNVTPYHPRDGYDLYLPAEISNSKIAQITPIKKRSISNRAKRSYRKIAGSVYKVRSGDNLYTIAKRHNINFKNLKRHNNIRGSRIYVGQKLKIPARKSKMKVYRVRGGDNLYSIARANHIKYSDLKRINKLKSSRIYIGQKLNIPASDAQVHTVKPGEYLLKIAKNYGTTLRKLRQINRKSFKKLYPGQKIIISYN